MLVLNYFVWLISFKGDALVQIAWATSVCVEGSYLAT